MRRSQFFKPDLLLPKCAANLKKLKVNARRTSRLRTREANRRSHLEVEEYS